jgi:hypothetical protein
VRHAQNAARQEQRGAGGGQELASFGGHGVISLSI